MTSRATVERRPQIALAAAMAVAAALILWESRDNSFFNDEVALFQSLAGGFDLDTVLAPRNGHLLATSTLLYELVFATAGPDYAVFRVIGVAGLLVLAALLFVYARRRLGPALALAPAVVVLFLGAAWEALLWPISIATFGFALAAGIGALLCLERGDRRGDVAACALLVLAVASHSIGLPFVVGAAVLAYRENGGRAGRRRMWIAAVPLLLYAAWWLWALKFDASSELEAVNAWLIPAYVADALAAVLAAITGLSATLSDGGVNQTIEIELGWGRVLAVAAVAALALRLARRPVPTALWAALAVLLVYWSLAALSLGPDRSPEESRYLLPGAVLFFLVASGALAGLRIPRAATIAILVVSAVAVATGIRQLHDGELFLRDYSLRARATAAGIERAGGTVPYGYEPRADPALAELVPPQLPLQAGPYLEAVDRYGSIAFSDDELAEQDPAVQEVAEQVYLRAREAS